MNNEPVAWMARNELLFSVVEDEIYHIPLYIHPAKTLTDEEILALWTQKNNLNGAKDVVDFARAILRKAQEK